MSIGGRIAADFLLAAAPGFLVGLADGLHVFHGAYFELGSFHYTLSLLVDFRQRGHIPRAPCGMMTREATERPWEAFLEWIISCCKLGSGVGKV